MIYEKELEAAKKAAKRAGLIIMDVYSSQVKVNYKKDNSPLTIADRKANDLIVENLSRKFPNYAILSEELPPSEDRLENEYCWCIDPLDGTSDFINKTNNFSVNIALIKNKRPVLGVIYIPFFDQLFFGVKDNGSYVLANGEVKVLSVSERTSDLRVLTSSIHKSDKFLDLLDNNIHRISSVVGMGSAFKGCKIAQGLFDCYYRFGLTCEWDTAAMELIVTEAGGIFRQMDGSIMYYNREDVYNRKGFYIINKEENNLL